MKAYFDASCLASLALRDAGWENTRDWIVACQPELSFSDLGWGEVVSAIGARCRGRSIDLSDARDAITWIEGRIARWERHLLLTTDIAEATASVADFTLALRLPDAMHLAMARRLGATLLTNDRIQARAAATLGIACVDPTRLD